MKSNNKTSIILLVCALVAGGAGWYLSKNYIKEEVATYKATFDVERELLSVVVANQDLKIGDVVSPATASVRQIPKTFVPANAVGPDRFDLLDGRQITNAVKRGDPVLEISVSNVKVAGLASLLKEGERAITIPVTTRDTFSGFLNPGDDIDLYITLKDGDEKRTVPLAQKLKVLATGDDLDDGVPEQKKKRVSEITLGVAPLVATRLIHAQTVGEISVLLRKPDDDGDRFNDYVTIDNLVDIPQERKPEPPPPAPKSQWGFELIKGGKRS